MQSHQDIFQFNELSLELKVYLFEFLNLETLVASSKATKECNFLSNQNSVWLTLLKKDFGLDYKEFLESIADNTKVHSTTPPKEVYKFLKKLQDIYLLLCDVHDIKPFAFFTEIAPRAASTFGTVATIQALILLRKKCPHNTLTAIEGLLKEMYSLIENHFEIACLMVSDGFTINDPIGHDIKVTNLAIVNLLHQIHMQRFKTLNFNLSAFEEPYESLKFLTFSTRHNISKLIFPLELEGEDKVFKLVTDDIPELETLILVCDSKTFNLYQKDEDFIEKVKKLLSESNNLHTIELKDKSNPAKNVCVKKQQSLTRNLS